MFKVQFNRSLVSSLVLLTAIGGCAGARDEGGSDGETVAELEGVPELSAVQMGLTEDSQSEGTATEDDMIDPDAVADDLEMLEVPENAAEDMVAGQQAIRHLNQGLRNFLTPVVRLVRNTAPTEQLGAIKVWGPVVEAGVEYRLLVRHASSGRYAWRLDARPEESNGSYQRVAVGRLVRGAEARRGKGGMGVDLDALGELNGEVKARGKVLIGFRHGDAGTTVGYGLRGFTADPSLDDGVDAVARAVHLKGGVNRLRLAFHGDVPGSASDAKELMLARLRHLRGVGGRSDVVVVGGDVPEGQVWVRSQCWTKGLEKVFSEVSLCPLDLPVDLSLCEVQETDGDVTACDKSLRDAELPPSDPEAPMDDAKDPNADVEIPADFDELTDPDLG